MKRVPTGHPTGRGIRNGRLSRPLSDAGTAPCRAPVYAAREWVAVWFRTDIISRARAMTIVGTRGAADRLPSPRGAV
jgi:hypothetical protein